MSKWIHTNNLSEHLPAQKMGLSFIYEVQKDLRLEGLLGVDLRCFEFYRTLFCVVQNTCSKLG